MRTLLMAVGLCGLLLAPIPDAAHGGPTKTKHAKTTQVQTKPVQTKPVQTKKAQTKKAQTKKAQTKKAQTKKVQTKQVGLASWYGKPHQGRKTASGERFSRQRLTAAHRSLPMGTKVQVTNLRTKQQVVVTINDRGPYAGGQRIIDLSEAAAKQVGLLERGTERVEVVVVEPAS